MPKSMKTAFIRVSKYNDTKSGKVVFEYGQIKNDLEEWAKNKKFKYYLKDHNNETGDENPHYHIVIKFNSPTPFEDVKKHFPYGDIEPAKSIKNCVQYLVHMNDLTKTQYDFSTIITNDPNIDKMRLISATNQLLKLDDYIIRIESGEIREYNLTDFVPIQIFATYKTRIINALEYYRRKVMTNKDRNINVMIFTGETGTYKTTYAKQYAKNQNKSICISSSSNDPMQDYKGEDVLVLDDIRDDTFKFHDLLKVLDNHTNSTIASRYNNKAFIGDTIIITSSQPLSEWYFDVKKEDKIQLYRRIPVQMQFTEKWITVYEFKKEAKKYVLSFRVPNLNKYDADKSKSMALGILESMGVQIADDIKQKISEKADQAFNGHDFGEYWEESQNKEAVLSDGFTSMSGDQISIFEGENNGKVLSH